MPIWEYKIISVEMGSDRAIQDANTYLAKAGQEGWELVSVSSFLRNGFTYSHQLWLKRAYERDRPESPNDDPFLKPRRT